MSESALQKLARLAGGVLLTQGRLGHQVLGQLLIVGPTELEVAAATVVLSASNGRGNAVVQSAVRTLVPALALHLLQQKQERRLQSLISNAQGRERNEEQWRAAEGEREVLESEIAALRAELSRRPPLVNGAASNGLLAGAADGPAGPKKRARKAKRGGKP
jgi:hypothetical protein